MTTGDTNNDTADEEGAAAGSSDPVKRATFELFLKPSGIFV
eukprot:CAMPEP_0118802006 /NCGR_PEP_ID=MMETSP1161-20130426/3469_1 /TAXON_ID=249345 /ORGANISM="Picochlorum oklahomensis, Strain CCMP2329" /LENGTH=40 /DNA_ID= /DNA_START= /DNA_END= /DNA_ORIENTATION=